MDEPEAVAEESVQPVAATGDWWTIMVGSGFRRTTDALTDEERRHVRTRMTAALVGESELRTPVVYGSARKTT